MSLSYSEEDLMLKKITKKVGPKAKSGINKVRTAVNKTKRSTAKKAKKTAGKVKAEHKRIKAKGSAAAKRVRDFLD